MSEASTKTVNVTLEIDPDAKGYRTRLVDDTGREIPTTDIRVHFPVGMAATATAIVRVSNVRVREPFRPEEHH